MPRKSKKSLSSKTNVQRRWDYAEIETQTPDVVVVDKEIPAAQKASDYSRKSAGCSIDLSLQVLETAKYIFICTDILKDLFGTVLCSSCKEPTLHMELGEKYGFAHKLKLTCTTCASKNDVFTSKRLSSEVSKTAHYDVNIRAVQAFLEISGGHAAVEKFCMALNMSLMSSKTFNDIKLYLADQYKVTSKTLLSYVHKKVKKAYNCVTSEAKSDDITDISVSYDGTWLTRGHTSAIGVGCIIDILTGYVLDYEIMSKFCTHCSSAKKDLGEESPEFAFWYASHKPDCQVNHFGSSGAMEMIAAEVLWSRSESLGFRYITLLSDGDAKTHTHLNNKRVYGPGVQIQKEECVNHVSKRLGTGLRNVVKEYRVKGETLGGRAHGSLKETTIKKLTQYYQNAIMRNKDNAKAMKSDIYATLYHCISSDEKPMHFKCPTGRESWCFYQRAIAQKLKPGSHKVHVGTPLNPAILPKVMPVYQRLACDELLKRCEKCLTQNANESLHSIIWSKCSKETAATSRRVEIAVSSAVSEFNMGTLQAMKECQNTAGIEFGLEAAKIAATRDYRRLKQRKRKSEITNMVARRKLKLACIRKDSKVKKKEGIVYGAGCF